MTLPLLLSVSPFPLECAGYKSINAFFMSMVIFPDSHGRCEECSSPLRRLDPLFAFPIPTPFTLFLCLYKGLRFFFFFFFCVVSPREVLPLGLPQSSPFPLG